MRPRLTSVLASGKNLNPETNWKCVEDNNYN